MLAGLFALVTACAGGGDGDGDGVASVSDGNTPSSSGQEPAGSDVDQMRAYAKCMREHGVDMADPEVSGDGGIGLSVEGGEKEEVDKADKACKKLLPNGGEPPKPSAEDLDKMRETARCMREHGVDVPDPTMDDPGIRIDSSGADQDKVQKAMEECGDGEGSISVHQDGGGK